jgi:hypothetical protein
VVGDAPFPAARRGVDDTATAANESDADAFEAERVRVVVVVVVVVCGIVWTEGVAGAGAAFPNAQL